MIASVRGTLVSASPLQAVVETGGIGYEIHIPITTAERLGSIGANILLHTLAVYREDSATLYGFITTAERDFFRLLIEKASGVGPKVALGLLSHFSLPSLQAAIATSDIDALSKCPGIGRKTAERIIIDLKDKLGPTSAVVPGAASSNALSSLALPQNLSDAIAALTALGYKPADAEKSIRKALAALGPAATTEALIKHALS